MSAPRRSTSTSCSRRSPGSARDVTVVGGAGAGRGADFQARHPPGRNRVAQLRTGDAVPAAAGPVGHAVLPTRARRPATRTSTCAAFPQTRMNVTIDGMPINEPEDSAFYFSNFGDFANAVDSIQVQRGVGTSSVGAASFVGSINFASADVRRASRAPRCGWARAASGASVCSATLNSGHVRPRLPALRAGGRCRNPTGSATTPACASRASTSAPCSSRARRTSRSSGSSAGRSRSLAYLAADEATLAVEPAGEPAHARRARSVRPAASSRRSITGRCRPAAEISAQGFYNGADGWYRIANAAAGTSGLYQYGLGWHNAGASVTYARRRARAPTSAGARSSATSPAATPATSSRGRADYVNRGLQARVQHVREVRLVGRALAAVRRRPAAMGASSATRGRLPLGSVDWTFFNPKAGARFDAGHGVSLFASIGRGEPRAGPVGHAQGEDNPTDAVRSRRRPSRAGAGHRVGREPTRARGFTAEVNGYLMAFRHEIAQTGELSEIGLPLRRNVDRSYRRGIEVDLTWRPVEPLQIRHTATYSLQPDRHVDAVLRRVRCQRQLDRGDEPRPPRRPAVRHARRSSRHLAATTRRPRGATIGAAWRYVGESHLDNTGQRRLHRPVVRVPGHQRLGRSGADSHRSPPAAHPVLRVQVTNVLDNRRMFPNGYSYQYFAAGPDPRRARAPGHALLLPAGDARRVRRPRIEVLRRRCRPSRSWAP